MAGEWRRWTKHKVTVTVHIKRWFRGGFDMIEVMQPIIIVIVTISYEDVTHFFRFTSSSDLTHIIYYPIDSLHTKVHKQCE